MITLLDELNTGPLSAELAPYIASGDDGTILAILNRKDINAYGIITSNLFGVWAASTGQRAIIEDTANNSNDPLRSIALVLIDFLKKDNGIFDLSRTDIQTMTQAWFSNGKMDSATHDSLYALSTVKISRAEQLGLNVTIQDIAQALRG